MGLLLRTLILLLAVGSAGCRKGAQPVSQPCTGAGVKTLGQACATNCECASGVCYAFGDGGQVCAQRCTDSSQCPPGSRGQKCNKEGVCRI
jgi:hypothetical protein